MTGGGWGGCVVALTEPGAVDVSAYESAWWVRPSSGADVRLGRSGSVGPRRPCGPGTVATAGCLGAVGRASSDLPQRDAGTANRMVRGQANARRLVDSSAGEAASCSAMYGWKVIVAPSSNLRRIRQSR